MLHHYASQTRRKGLQRFKAMIAPFVLSNIAHQQSYWVVAYKYFIVA
jgi:hypothetical protein